MAGEIACVVGRLNITEKLVIFKCWPGGGIACTISGMNPSTTNKLFFYLALWLGLLPLAGCGPSQKQIAARTATAQTAVAALWTPTPTSTGTATSTATPTSTATSTITPTTSPSQTPTLTPIPTTTSGSRASFTIRGVTFSFVPPEGWKKTDDPNHVILNVPTVAGTQMILTFSLDQYSLLGKPMDADEIGISMFSAHVQNKLVGMTKNVVQISEDFLNTADDNPYFRWVMEHNTNGKEQHMVFYIFGTGKWFLTVMYGRPKSAGSEYDPLIDEAMKTLMFEQ